MDRHDPDNPATNGGFATFGRRGRGLADAAAPGGRVSTADLLARGVCRWLSDRGYGTLTEFRVGKGRRVDVIGLNRDSRFVIVEIKTSETDFRTDGKWPEYLPWCDAYYFAVPAGFPQHILPEDHGLMVADSYDAAVLRESSEMTMNATRRRTQILRFGLAASARLRAATDPWPDSPQSRLGR